MRNQPLRAISLGWGVQSWTLAAMVALKELPAVDYAIHADTGHERAETYAHAKKWTPWLERRGVQVVTVSGARTEAVREDWKDSVMIPAFTTDRDTGSRGQVLRQCTHDWKITPIRRFIRSVIGALTPGAVESLQGISFDEWSRIRTSDVAYITNVYPLVDAQITRAGCVTWLEAQGLDVPVKSACTFCPYHNLEEWKRLKREGGPDWQEAVEVDGAIREKRPKAELFIHPARAPLSEAIKIAEDYGASQLALDLDSETEASCDSGYCFT